MVQQTMPLGKGEQTAGTLITALAVALFLVYLSFSFIPFDSEIKFLSMIGINLMIPLFLCFFVLMKLRKGNRLSEIDYLNIGVQRNILGLMMIFYGVSKLFGNFFDYQLFALDSKLKDVSEFELAWYFYGKNRWQELFTGIMEFVPGLLLLHRRTYYTTSLILLPVTAQVFLLNFFFKIGGITFPAAIILLACNIYIIYSQKEKIIRFFQSLDFSPNHSLVAKPVIKLCRAAGITLAALIIFMNVKRTFFKSEYQRQYEKLVGIYTLEKMKKNNTDYSPGENDSLYYKDIYIEKQNRWNILRRFNNRTDAFVMNLNIHNDSMKIYLNNGGTGDDPDILDSLTVLNGVYELKGDWLIISGKQINDTLQLSYKKQPLKPKEWFW